MDILAMYVGMILVAVMIVMGIAYLMFIKIDERQAAREHALDLERIIMEKRMEYENRRRLQDSEIQKKTAMINKIIEKWPDIMEDTMKKMEDL